MTETTADPTLARITEAVGAFQAGNRTAARRDMIDLWNEIRPDGDPFHRCVLAHHLADMVTDAAEALMWDTRALDAADVLSDARLRTHHESLQVAAFYPSLHLNLADDLRRLGSFRPAAGHLDDARRRVDLLADDAYGAMLLEGIARVAEAVERRSTEPIPGAPGTA
ncbi:hypothetical protein QSJ19_01845 [Gordonia sp. ABSL11-1]|uniref:hypothetical protein n=1 Tax=Gordonia sp. ABSL11-1 TaxID=3053924 RepID=UPI0025740B94|nr:hypothetical protein [Gordonia sp. ABSL11-1]MDL9944343.1 hypothetical protein [Gordonia sp. ABSL11-1]